MGFDSCVIPEKTKFEGQVVLESCAEMVEWMLVNDLKGVDDVGIHVLDDAVAMLFLLGDACTITVKL